MHQAVARAFAKVASHLLIQLVILEQHIQVLEHRIDALGHLRHACKDVFWFVAISQHGLSPDGLSLPWRLATLMRFAEQPPHPLCQHVLRLGA
jgi:hypothetical protein